MNVASLVEGREIEVLEAGAPVQLVVIIQANALSLSLAERSTRKSTVKKSD